MDPAKGKGFEEIPYYQPDKPEKKKAKLSTDEQQQSNDLGTSSAGISTNTNNNASGSSMKNSEALMQQEAMRSKITSQLETTSIDSKPPSPAVVKQIEIINNLMTEGILSEDRSAALKLSTTSSSDMKSDTRHQTVYPDRVSLNHVSSNQGKEVCITHRAKGGLTVVMERQSDPLANKPIDEPLLDELSERTQCSILIVLTCNKVDESNAKLHLIKPNGEEFENKDTHIYNASDGCFELKAAGSVSPKNFAYVILPETLRPYRNQLKIDDTKIKFVPLSKQALVFNAEGQVKGRVNVTCPNYQEGLKDLKEQEFFTHMVRTPTTYDLNRTNK